MKMIKKGFRRLGLIMITTVLLTGSVLPVAAEEPAGIEIDQFDIDLDRTGSIKVWLSFARDYNKEDAAEITVYEVADIVKNDSVYEYQYTSDFSGCNIPIDQMITDATGSINQAASLADYVQNNKISALTKASADIVDEKNNMVWAEVGHLRPGAYLIIETKIPEYYQQNEPVLVTVPYADPSTGEAVYDITAYTKMQPKRREPETTPETKPETTPETTPETKPPHKPGLPQTGQLWWPVPILLAAGILFIILGIIKRKDR